MKMIIKKIKFINNSINKFNNLKKNVYKKVINKLSSIFKKN